METGTKLREDPLMNPELEKVGHEYKRLKAKMSDVQRRMYDLIYEFSKTDGDERGWQTEVVQATGLTRERIRQIIKIERDRREGAGK